MDKEGNLKICDFGQSTKFHESRFTMCGTLDYMSPEILKRENHDKKVDIWTLGILLFELLHGYAPFETKGKDKEIILK